MNKNRVPILLLTVLLAIFVCTQIVEDKGELPLSFMVSYDENGQTETVKLWKNDNEVHYVFVPSYVDLSQVKIAISKDVLGQIGSIPLVDEMSCAAFEVNKEYDYIFTRAGKDNVGTIVFIKSDNVATMYIETQSGNMDFVHSNKDNKESGSARVYTDTGILQYDGAITSISGRGNTTWDEFEKKPYSITLAEEADLLGMGSAQKWVLLANAADPSHMRNKIVYDFAKELRLDYSPDSQWVDLYLNGEYTGLYLLCERIEVHSERVDILQTDSFLVSKEYHSKLMEKNVPYIITEAGQSIRIHSGNEEMVLNSLQSVENAILSENGVDSSTGKSLTQLIDLNSWVKKYLIEEVFGNTDAGHASQYYYRPGPQEVVYAGPVWDYDNALWSVNAHNFFGNQLEIKAGIYSPWFYTLYRNQEFYDRVVNDYEVLMRPKLSDFIYNKIPLYLLQIEDAAEMDKVRWSGELGSIHEHVEDIYEFLINRISFLDKVWLDGCTYNLVRIDVGNGSNYLYYAAISGEHIQALPGETNPLFASWVNADTGEIFSTPQVISEDVQIYAKYKEMDSSQKRVLQESVPIFSIFLLGIVILVCEIKRNKKGDTK